jgi:hypothetical protein
MISGAAFAGQKMKAIGLELEIDVPQYGRPDGVTHFDVFEADHRARPFALTKRSCS